MIPTTLRVESSSSCCQIVSRGSGYWGVERKQRAGGGGRGVGMVSAEGLNHQERKEKELAEPRDGPKRRKWGLEQRHLFIKSLNFFWGSKLCMSKKYKYMFVKIQKYIKRKFWITHIQYSYFPETSTVSILLNFSSYYFRSISGDHTYSFLYY